MKNKSIDQAIEFCDGEIVGQMKIGSDVPVGYHKYRVYYQIVACYGKDRKPVSGTLKGVTIAKDIEEMKAKLRAFVRKTDSHYYPIIEKTEILE